MKLVLAAVALAACAGDPPQTTADAPASSGNLQFGATCVTTSDMSTECASGVCTNSIDQLGHDVCSQKCTIGMDSTCPATGPSMVAKCNGKGYCKP